MIEIYEKLVGKRIKLVYDDGPGDVTITWGIVKEFDSETKTLVIENEVNGNKVFVQLSRIHKLILPEEK